MSNDRWTNRPWSYYYEEAGWHKDGGNYHNLRWYQQILSEIEIKSNGKLLIYDYGCGEGDGTVLLKCHFPFAYVTGVDFDPIAVERAKKRWPKTDIRWIVGDVTEPEPCHVAFSIQTVDHVENVAECINNLCAVSQLVVIAWAVLRHLPSHPSQDRAWMDRLDTQPALQKTYKQPRVFEGRVYEDEVELMVWKKEQG